jgi:hypothetical protein
MGLKKLIFVFALILFCANIPFIFGTTSSTVTVNYDFSNTYFIDDTIYKVDSMVLRIKTSIETTCVYGTSYSPSNAFEGEYGLTHEIYFENLEEGLHKYYIRCGIISNPVMEINFATSIPIYATIKISEEPPLKAGRYKINLITSKTSLGTPTLEYSFDELVYKPVSLKGTEKNWEGNLIIPESAGEVMCSFRFKARDLSGQEGTKIVGDNSFLVDTSKPATITTINAVGYKGEIKLNWFSEEGIYEFNVYRSEDPQVDYIDFYKTSAKQYFYDNDVEKGKTYYYRVAGVDEAGNIGDLSREVYATALLNNYSEEKGGLDTRLVGKVDNFISEINSLIQNVEEISSLIDLKEEKEKDLFKNIKLDKEVDSAISELNSLKRDVESYKLQDLSEIELNKKIDSATLRLNIIKKKVPEDITIINEKSIKRELNEEAIQLAFLEYSPETGGDFKKDITETLKIINEKEININSNFYGLEVMYLDGTKKTITVVEDNIESGIDNKEDIANLYFLLVVPKEIAEKSSEIKIMNLEYDVIKEDPVISFNSDIKSIIYYINKEISLDSLEKISITPIKILEEESTDSKITGKSILNLDSGGSWGIIALALVAFILGIYFLKVKREPSIKPVLMIIENIKKTKELLESGKEIEAKEIYQKVKEEYKLLSDKEKIIVIESINNIGVNFQNG